MNFVYRKDSHIINIAEAFLVVIIWATSWIIIKNNLSNIPPLLCRDEIFSGISLSADMVLFFGKDRRNPGDREENMALLVLLGIAMYTAAQGDSILLFHIFPQTMYLFL